MVYILNLKDLASFLNGCILSLYQGLNRGLSYPEVDDIPMCHGASLLPIVSLKPSKGW